MKGKHQGGYHKVLETKVADPNSLPEKYCANNFMIVYYLARAGYSDKQIAEALDVYDGVIAYHKEKNPAFMDAFKRGRVEANLVVADGLFLNCQDRYVDVEEVHMYKDKPIIVKKKLFVQGHSWSQVKWLELRDRVHWSIMSQAEARNVHNTINYNYNMLSSEELKLMESIQKKQIPPEGEHG
jgi:hypothetical protein